MIENCLFSIVSATAEIIAGQLPCDSGPIYAETQMNRFPVEPWNTVTILPFFFVALYWAMLIRKAIRQHLFIAISIPLLLVGFVGGGMYHACRCNNLWFRLDYIPIVMLVLIAALTFWVRLFATRKNLFRAAALLIIALYLPLIALGASVPKQLAISIGYVNMALLVLLPTYLFCFTQDWKHLKPLALATACFVIAVSFRVYDFHPALLTLFPMGTHFLWHLFGAACAFYLLRYEYEQSKAPGHMGAESLHSA